MKKLLITLMVSIIILSCLMMPTYAMEFTDLPVDHWAYEYITSLTNAGVINRNGRWNV